RRASVDSGVNNNRAPVTHHRDERFFALHPPADRDIPPRRRGDAGWRARLLVAAGFRAAAGGLPHHSGRHTASGRQSRYHGVAGDGTTRTPVRANSRDDDDEFVVEL